MLHLRRTGPQRAVQTLGSALPALWDRLIAADPGLLRLLLAARGTVAVFLVTLIAIGLGNALAVPAITMAPGITFTLMATFLMREPTRQQRERTLLRLAIPAAMAAIATTVLHDQGEVGDAFFLVLVFVCFLLQGYSPEAIGQGLVAVVISYVGLYLELPPATLPVQVLSIAVALPALWFVCFVLLPMRPAAQLRRTVQAVQGRAAAVLQDASQLSADNPATAQRLRRSLARLTEAALAADDQLALLDPAGSLQTRLRLIDLELAVARLSALPADTTDSARRRATQLVVHQRRLRRGRWSARHLVGLPPTIARSPIAAALAEVTQAASALGRAGAELPADWRSPPQRPPPGPLAWRVATRVALASAIAMAGGMVISPHRWFWAVISTYVVFLNTRSRGDTVFRGLQRVAGTLLGLVAGLSLAALLGGNGVSEATLFAGAVFGMYYFFFVSYTLGIFFVTVLLGLLYSMLGADMGPLLVLRLEETAVGAGAAILVAVFVLPVRTRDQVGLSGAALLRALAEMVGACRAVFAGEDGASVVIAMRAVDRQVADLRLALMPLAVSRLFLRWSEDERPVPALLDCVHWARMLAVAAAAPDPAFVAAAEAIEHRLAALAHGERSIVQPLPRIASTGRTATALERLDQATAVLAERLTIGDLHGFHLGG